MLTVLFIVLASTLIVVIEVPTLKREKNRKDIVVFSILMLAGIVFGVCWGLGVVFPSPFQLLTVIYKPPYDLLMQLLG